ncbi:hypothetical protein RHGRI_026427 [Rhododendron griersonianum]|uniref:THH1/TOM1/TOM3 domain-containing protein n=1 Tax=Rhododendron griersonianum TaxID=479676 RepID=A0AAV6ISX2_9ERIC|nr:hypothetical protein RHGRI_026427 [Rhododendron griersonianum]
MARTVVGPPAVVAYALTEASNWWDQINESPAWQDRIFHVLAALYGVVAVVALIVLWLIIWWKPIPPLMILSKMFFAGVSLFAALGFLVYGGRLFLMLQRFPVESKGRRKKLQEAYVGYVTTICFTCFLVRGIMMCFNAFDKAADLDVLDHPVLNFIYYLLVEILPSSLVLFILRKLPPKRGITQYHPIR